MRRFLSLSLLGLFLAASSCTKVVPMKDFGLSAESAENAAEKIRRAFAYCKSLDRPVVLRLEKGVYDIVLDQDGPEPSWLLEIEDMKDFVFDGGGSTLYMKGLKGLADVRTAKNIGFRNFSIDWKRPYITQAEVVETAADHIDLKIDSLKYPYRIVDGFVSYLCDDGLYDVVKDSYCNYLTPEGKIVPGTQDDYRLYQVLNGRVEERPGGVLRFSGPVESSAPAGSRLLIYHVRYKTPCFRAALSSRLELKNVTLHHCPGIGVLTDCCEDLVFDGVDFLPSGERLFTAVADAFHVTHASGTVLMKHCQVDGQGDDAINVHGRYYRILDLSADRRMLTCKTRSAVPLIIPGDSLWLVSDGDMKRLKKYAALAFEPCPGQDPLFALRLTEPLELPAGRGDFFIENASRNPDVHIKGNHFGKGNRARGVLVTTPGKVVIEDNLFESSGAAILIEGDLSYWFESGGVRDVTIRNNEFRHCRTSPWGAAVIALTPSTDRPGYHSGVRISGNDFLLDKGVEPLYTVDASAVHFADDNRLRR